VSVCVEVNLNYKINFTSVTLQLVTTANLLIMKQERLESTLELNLHAMSYFTLNKKSFLINFEIYQ